MCWVWREVWNCLTAGDFLELHQDEQLLLSDRIELDEDLFGNCCKTKEKAGIAD